MAKGPPSQRYGTPGGRFWVNVVLIALAHLALIAGLFRWSVAAKASSNPESIVWLGGAGDTSADESEKQELPSPKQPPAATKSSEPEQDEAADEKPVVTSAKSEIELPTATPKPTATATPLPKPTATPAVRAKTKQMRSRRKRTKLYSQKRIPRLTAEAGRADQQAKLAVPAVEAVRLNL